MGGFDPAAFDQEVANYEALAWSLDPAFGAAVSGAINRHWRAAAGGGRGNVNVSSLRGMGDLYTPYWDPTTVYVPSYYPVITDPAVPDWSGFSTDPSSSPDIGQGGEIIVTAPASEPSVYTAPGPIWTDLEQIAAGVIPNQDIFSQVVAPGTPGAITPPSSALSALKTAAGNTLKAIGSVLKGASLSAGAGGAAQAGAQRLQAAAGQPKQASFGPLLIFGLLIYGALMLANN